MTDIPKLIEKLENVGEEWSPTEQSPSFYRGLCRQAAAALKEQNAIAHHLIETSPATLRDQFAMAQLIAMGEWAMADPEHRAMYAFRQADACLKARKP